METREFLLTQKTGKQWYFTLSEDHKLQYSRKEDGEWTAPAVIDRQLVKSYGAAMDNSNNIYILAYTHTKQLVYYEWDGYQWLHRTIYRVNSRFENISFLSILPSKNTIHIFYYMENSLRKAQESLVHYYLDRGDWKTGQTLHYISDDGVSPQLIAADDKGFIHFIYIRRQREECACYYAVLNESTMSWTVPALVFRTPNTCSRFDLLSDDQQNIHLVWVESNFNRHLLKYRCRKREQNQKLSWGDELLLHEGPDIRYPIILIQGLPAPVCFWLGDKLQAASSNPEMNTLCLKAVDKYKENNLSVYQSVNYEAKAAPSSRSLIGSGYPYFEWSVEDVLETLSRHYNTAVSDMQNENTGKDYIDEYNNPRIMEDFIKHSDTQSARIDDIEKDIGQLKDQVSNLSNKLDDVYTSLYLIQEHLNQREKTINSLDMSVRKLSSDIENLRKIRSPYASGTTIKSPGYARVVDSNNTKAVSTLNADGKIKTNEAIPADKSNDAVRPTENSNDAVRPAEKQIDKAKPADKHFDEAAAITHSHEIKPAENLSDETTPADMHIDEAKPFDSHGNEADSGLKMISPAPNGTSVNEKKPEEILLGNVSILINPDNDDEKDD